MGNSKIIIVDEPTAGLDCNSKRELWELIKNTKQDKIILMTTHYMDEAENLGDKICILNKGKLDACGSVQFLRDQFSTDCNIEVSFENTE